MRLKRLIMVFTLFSALTAFAAIDGISRVFINGYWFDGSRFVPGTGFVQNGKLEVKAAVNSGKEDAEIVDLRGGYVVPPFCEGHNHNIAVGKPEERNLKYLAAGVFYVQILNDAPQIAETEKSFWAQEETIDVAFAQGGLTDRGGHPVELLEGIRKGGGYPPGTVLADSAYFEIETVDDLRKKWPIILSFNPDIIKLFLEFSEDYERRKDDPAFYGKRGLSREVFKLAVDLAHKEGRRVAAHMTSAHDFHLSVEAGVEVIAHLPGYKSIESISPVDATLAAKKKICVITTVSPMAK